MREKWAVKYCRAAICILFLLILCGNGFRNRKIVVAVLDTKYELEDSSGHGSKIRKLISEQVNSKVEILSIEVADYMGNATEEAIIKGIYEAIEQGADIIHMSINAAGKERDNQMTEAISAAYEKGIAVVVSAGNNAQNVEGIFPAYLEEPIVVSAVDEERLFCEYSNFGQTVDFAAYGRYGEEEGTSYAAARVTAMLAMELLQGGNEQTLREKCIDAGAAGRDPYYGYGILVTEDYEESVQKTEYAGKTSNDIGYDILKLNWREHDAEELNGYFTETNRAYVGMYLSRLSDEELQKLREKAEILNSKVLVQEFCLGEDDSYYETAHYEDDFVKNALEEYETYEKQLSVSADWLMLKNEGQFAVSSNNRQDIYLFTIRGFSYKVDTPDSPWFSMYNPDKLTVTRTIVKQTTDFGAVYVTDLDKYLCKVNAFAESYVHPETGNTIIEDNFLAIDSESDDGSLCYGLSIQLAGYKNKKEGYHTEEADIIQIPYNYQHTYSKYSYTAYPEPLTYIFAYYDAETNGTSFSTEPYRVEAQAKNFKKLITTNYNVWYNGEYKSGYNFSNVNPAYSFDQKLNIYLETWKKKVVTNVNIYSSESSLTETGFCINTNLQRSLALQWNNGETATVALKNDIPEYNFPLVLNTYTIKYNGNGASGGSMNQMAMTYNETKELAKNQFYRTGYIFKGWSESPTGSVKYSDGQQVKNLTTSHKVTVNLYAVWEPLTYTIVYDGNGASEGSMTDTTAFCAQAVKLKKNEYYRETEYGKSVFLGWSQSSDAFCAAYMDEEVVTDITANSGETVILYAVWDDCPWVEAEDLYFSLEEAQSGFITYDKLMQYAKANDREAGGTVLPGKDEEKGTEFILIDYAESTYTQMQQEGSVTETYRVTDSSGSIYEKAVTVYVIDTAADYPKPFGTTRFINEKYYRQEYERGGLEDNSVWRTQPEYINAIEEAFENIEKNTPIASFSYSYEEIQEMK